MHSKHLIDKEKIEPILNEILSLDKDSIKKRYRELRKSGHGTHSKGGGIGFFEIATKCDKINFSFKKINDDRFYFHIKTTTITKKNGEIKMELFKLDAIKYTPEIILDSAGTISLVGKSYPENTFEFYAPAIHWMEKYFETNPAETTTVNMEIIYFNSSSSKLFFDLLEKNSSSNKIDVNWIFDEDNESAEEAGEDFIEDFENLNIKLITK